MVLHHEKTKPNGIRFQTRRELLYGKDNQNTLKNIRKTATFEAPIQKVWDTVSTSEGI